MSRIKQSSFSKKKKKKPQNLNSTIGYVPKEDEIFIPKRYLHPHVHCSTIHNTQNMEPNQMPFCEWKDKEVVIYLHNTIPISHRKEQNLVMCSNMDGTLCCMKQAKHRRKNTMCSHIFMETMLSQFFITVTKYPRKTT
jgi:hypothetical protein